MIRNLPGAVLLTVFAGFSGIAGEPGQFVVGLAGDVMAPSSETFKHSYNTGFGVSARAQYDASTILSVMLTAGYVTFPADLPGDVGEDNAMMLPVVIGAKCTLLEGTFRPYGAVDIGVTTVQQVIRSPGEAGTDTSLEFTWQPQIGFEASVGKSTSVEMSARYVGISSLEALGFRAGILFAL
jgi:hypothetical protein